ncbi:MAG: S8 family peptidase [Thermoleophilaceae bacterium]
MRRLVPIAMLVCAGALAAAPAAHAVDAAPAAPDQVLVRYEPDSAPVERADARAEVGAKGEKPAGVPGWSLLRVKRGTVEAAASALEASDAVAQAQPNYRYHATMTPNDPMFGALWGLVNHGQPVLGNEGLPGADIRASQAWDITAGGPSGTVAVVDTGVDLNHPDLRGAGWVNPGESGNGRETNRVDDDHDGFVDDWQGWDWVGWDSSPVDEDGHGTHVAGSIAARGNNGVGVVGVAWRSSVMPLRVLDAGGSGWTSDIAAAFSYAAAHGVRVVNASLGGPGADPMLREAIANAPNTLFVVAAGNEGESNDSKPEYPCAYPEANIVCVASTDASDRLSTFSNWGAGSVDVAAPGESILSTLAGGGYGYMDGTSMATPQVSGVASLVLSAHPDDTASQLRAALLGGADHPGLGRPLSSGGRVNAYGAVTFGTPAATGVPTPARAPATTLSLPSSARLAKLLGRGVPVRCKLDEAGTCALELRVGARDRKRLAMRASVLASARASLGAAGAATLRLRLRGANATRIRSALRRSARVRLDVRVVAADSAGHQTRLARRLAVRR